jgi:hypothetical protein
MAQSSYYTAWLITNNTDLTMRVAASVQQESERSGTPVDDPQIWAQAHRWDWGTQSDWVAAVSAAIETGITAWGQVPGVVTDQMILSWTQAALAAETLPT